MLACTVFLFLIILNHSTQDYMPHGSQGLFTQAGFTGPSQDESSQSHFGVTGPLRSQVTGFVSLDGPA